MATTFYTTAEKPSSSAESYVRAKCVYSTSESSTAVTVSGTVYLQHKGAALTVQYVTCSAAAGIVNSSNNMFDQKVETDSVTSFSKHTDWTDVKSKAFSFSVAKGESARTEYIGAASYYLNLYSDVSKAVSVPALASYPVTYNANGGSGAPASQTKYYGKALSLRPTQPTRSGYVFEHWNTNAADTGTDYSPGGSYATNAALSLYAIWEPYPKITSLTAERCTSAGVLDDDGEYALVTCVWSIDSTLGDTATLTGSIATGGSSTAITFSSGASGTGGTAVAIVPNVDPDYKYVVTVTAANGLLTDERSVIIPGAAFMLDFAAGGGAVGIGCPAPEDGLEVGFDITFSGKVMQGAEVNANSADNTAYPLYIWDSNHTDPASYSGTYPVSPCFVYYLPNNGLYYCTN